MTLCSIRANTKKSNLNALEFNDLYKNVQNLAQQYISILNKAISK